jgi:hypothetical protein
MGQSDKSSLVDIPGGVSAVHPAYPSSYPEKEAGTPFYLKNSCPDCGQMQKDELVHHIPEQ